MTGRPEKTVVVSNPTRPGWLKNLFIVVNGDFAEGGFVNFEPPYCEKHSHAIGPRRCLECNTEAVDRLSRWPSVVSIEIRKP
jgi:hypothetical protein